MENIETLQSVYYLVGIVGWCLLIMLIGAMATGGGLE